MYATTFDVSKFYLNNINLIMYINIKKIEKHVFKIFHNICCIFDKPRLGEHKSWLSKTLKKSYRP